MLNWLFIFIITIFKSPVVIITNQNHYAKLTLSAWSMNWTYHYDLYWFSKTKNMVENRKDGTKQKHWSWSKTWVRGVSRGVPSHISWLFSLTFGTCLFLRNYVMMNLIILKYVAYVLCSTVGVGLSLWYHTVMLQWDFVYLDPL